MRTLRRSPPRLIRGFTRIVWLLNATPLSDGAGDAAHVPTQCLLPCICLPPSTTIYEPDRAALSGATAIFFTAPAPLPAGRTGAMGSTHRSVHPPGDCASEVIEC